MKFINIDKKKYQVQDNEFESFSIKEFCNLKLYQDIPNQERLIGLLNDISNDLNIQNLYCFETSHGGFIPIKCSQTFKRVNVINSIEDQLNHINFNVKQHNIKNIDFNFIDFNKLNEDYIIYIQNDNKINNNFSYLNQENLLYLKQINNIILSNISLDIILNIHQFKVFNLSNTNYKLYIPYKLLDQFLQFFNYYINKDDQNLLEYDNLINLCIMVKNAGPQFEQMLLDNKHLIDRWTILDTGSTDDTISIIKKVLNDKKGNLYQEEFINFRDSRNNLLELAGQTCKFKLMLDDTYIVQGNLREFLNNVRSDQYSDSFTLYISSNDVKYGSNRITKSYTNLRYKYRIHEVITDENNINVVIPETNSFILDKRFDYMEERTNSRKLLDLKLLFEEIEENPMDPRTYYYLAQTYNCIGDYENAYKYFLKRAEFRNSGFQQELIDAIFEAGRIANFKLEKPWEECLKLYKLAYHLDETRPDSLYFIGIHYFLEGNEHKAYHYFKKAFEIGFPIHAQYSLKPTLSFLYLPKYLAKVCYSLEDYELGLKACELYLQNNNEKNDEYGEMLSWYSIFLKLNEYKGPRVPNLPIKPIFCFVAPGGFNKWSGKSILNSGVGGSETYIIEMARYIKKHGYFDVYVFCDCDNEEVFEGVHYRYLNSYAEFINTNYIHSVLVSRYSEYIPLTIKGWSENIYLVVHDLSTSGNVIPAHSKLKKIFTLSEWHAQYFKNIFPIFENIITPFYYGIDFNKFNLNYNINKKNKYSFIYSSFANRGLLPLLQMWPRIYNTQPKASLHIYCDLENKWLNDNHKQQVIQIKKLFKEYNVENNGLNIFYYGWVDKKTLSEAWLKAEYWFYPCIFLETFCLTALEAAITKTFVITNGIGSLTNTVGNRGLIIPGDPLTTEWQNNAFNEIEPYLHDQIDFIKNILIEKNYNWALPLSWENQANKLLNEYILTNKFEYKNMYNWTNDVPKNSKNIFIDIIHTFNNSYQKCINNEIIKVLEIGSYTGLSLIEIIKLIPNSIGIGIDKWESYEENNDLKFLEFLGVEQSFYKNINEAKLQNRITGIKGNSFNILLDFIKKNKKFDFIYLDGSHKLLDCYSDIILSWQILEIGGILAIDDIPFNLDKSKTKYDHNNVYDTIFQAANHFCLQNQNKYEILHSGYRLFLKKLQ